MMRDGLNMKMITAFTTGLTVLGALTGTAMNEYLAETAPPPDSKRIVLAAKFLGGNAAPSPIGSAVPDQVREANRPDLNRETASEPGQTNTAYPPLALTTAVHKSARH